MKKLFVVVLLILFVVGCKKNPVTKPLPPAQPQMRYTELNNTVIRFEEQKAINLDGDNINDLLFSTMGVGDPILKRDRHQYFINSNFHVSLLIGQEEDIPVINNGDSIQIQDHRGCNWYNGNAIVLAEKIIELNGTEHWEGNWKNASHKYVAVQIKKDTNRYNGWVEVSFDTDREAMILHRAAISVEPNKTVVAGY